MGGELKERFGVYGWSFSVMVAEVEGGALCWVPDKTIGVVCGCCSDEELSLLVVSGLRRLGAGMGLSRGGLTLTCVLSHDLSTGSRGLLSCEEERLPTCDWQGCVDAWVLERKGIGA